MNFSRLSINNRTSILSAIKQMDVNETKMLLVYDNDKFYSIITIGDIQRAIIKNINLNSPIKDIIVVSKKKFASVNDSEKEIKNMMLSMRAQFMPVIDDNGNLVNVYSWNDFFPTEEVKQKKRIDLPVVIMAGGKGTRLKPLTNVIPKPLIPIGEKTIIEEIMGQFEEIGCSKFYISVNYKVDMLKFYLDKLNLSYDISYFEENRPLGTIGSVSLLKDKISTSFFVSNCDILIDQDYRDVYDYHKENHNDLTIVTAVKSIRIPYGVIESGNDGLLMNLSEKPENPYMINTGVYILEPNLIGEIPENQFFHITDLMQKIKERGGRIGCFPVSEKSWKDLGEWSEYLKMINVL